MSIFVYNLKDMILSQLWDSLLAILRKESKGLAVSPDDFTRLLEVENYSLFNEYYRAFEVNQSVSDALRQFKETLTSDLVYDTPTRTMSLSLPADYRHLSSLFVSGRRVVNWANGENPVGSTDASYDTLTSVGSDITSLIKSSVPAAIAGIDEADAVAVTVGDDYVFDIILTDNSVSQDSDKPTLKIYSYNSGVYTLISSTVIQWGNNNISFTATKSAMVAFITMAVGLLCDVSMTIGLYAGTGDVSLYPQIDIVTDEEWGSRKNDALTKATSDYPIARIAGDYVYIHPIDIDSVTLLYLRAPDNPFMDYYYDANLNIVPLDVNESRVLQAGEIYRAGNVYPYTAHSQTVELEWEDLDQIKILHRVLAKLGVSMDEQLVAQYALSQKDS